MKSAFPSLESLEAAYKTPYSHGLEEIYSIKNIDLKTVKRLQVADSPSSGKRSAAVAHAAPLRELQLELDLGDTYRGWIQPFIPREPIRVLGLNLRAETCLQEHKLLLLRDLISKNLAELVLQKGIGHGHLDEIRDRLKEYIGNRSLERTYRIEFQSWIKAISAGLEPREIAIFLQPYGLEGLIHLSRGEAAEVRHADPSTKEKWTKGCYQALREPLKAAEVRHDMQRIVNVFIIPWMRTRYHKATVDELQQRVHRIADAGDQTSAILHFFSDVYFEGRFPITDYLHKMDTDVYVCDSFYVGAYAEIMERAAAYFYHPACYYPLRHLVGLLAREFSKEWKAYSDELIVEALRLSSKFRVTRGPSGRLEARLA